LNTNTNKQININIVLGTIVLIIVIIIGNNLKHTYMPFYENNKHISYVCPNEETIPYDNMLISIIVIYINNKSD